MNLILYQAYYQQEQLTHLDSTFTPYDNTANSEPHLRELPMWRKLLEQHKDSDLHWGLLSWRWLQKTGVPPIKFKEWILANEGYDVYHIDPFAHLANEFPNLWVQGNIWHPGMLEFARILFPKIGIDTPVEQYRYLPEDFGTCNYFIGNSKFWTSYLGFIDLCLKLCDEDERLSNYIYKEGREYNGHFIPYFSFVIERLFSVHNILNRQITVKKYHD